MEKLNKVEEIGNPYINKSFSFLLPMCGKSFKDFQYCMGCFVGDVNNPKYKDKILLLWKTNYSLFSYHHDFLIEHNLYEDSYYINDEYVMFVFNLPNGYEHNYHLFIEGKYSKFDDEYKKHILRFYANQDTTNVEHVMYKNEKLYKAWEQKLNVKISRDQEIGSIPDLEVEMFSLDKIEKRTKEWI